MSSTPRPQFASALIDAATVGPFLRALLAMGRGRLPAPKPARRPREIAA